MNEALRTMPTSCEAQPKAPLLGSLRCVKIPAQEQNKMLRVADIVAADGRLAGARQATGRRVEDEGAVQLSF